jgi:hypothetical protein
MPSTGTRSPKGVADTETLRDVTKVSSCVTGLMERTL